MHASSFPQSLVHVQLPPLDWCGDIPGGLKIFDKLRSFKFQPKNKNPPWDNTRPLREILPIDSIDLLLLGHRWYCRKGDGILKEQDP